jgi:uncharacterized membrane protein
MSREILGKCVNIGLLLGFIALALGVLLWFSQLMARFRFDMATSLVAGGFLVLIFALLAAKIVSKVD